MTKERLKSTISYTTTKESNMIKPFILCVADRYKDIRHIKTDYHYDSQTIISPLYNKELCQKYPSLYFYLRNIEPIYEKEKYHKLVLLLFTLLESKINELERDINRAITTNSLEDFLETMQNKVSRIRKNNQKLSFDDRILLWFFGCDGLNTGKSNDNAFSDYIKEIIQDDILIANILSDFRKAV